MIRSKPTASPTLSPTTFAPTGTDLTGYPTRYPTIYHPTVDSTTQHHKKGASVLREAFYMSIGAAVALAIAAVCVCVASWLDFHTDDPGEDV